MGIHHSGALSAAVLVLSIATSYGGPCSVEIEHMQERVDAMIAATAAAGASARQSIAATMHRQPTPGSIAAAEERLGEGERAVHALTALAQARAADRAADNSACQAALAEVERVLGP